jgi:hypothetical protein
VAREGWRGKGSEKEGRVKAKDMFREIIEKVAEKRKVQK